MSVSGALLLAGLVLARLGKPVVDESRGARGSVINNWPFTLCGCCCHWHWPMRALARPAASQAPRGTGPRIPLA
jgi:hypothetical protein